MENKKAKINKVNKIHELRKEIIDLSIFIDAAEQGRGSLIYNRNDFLYRFISRVNHDHEYILDTETSTIIVGVLKEKLEKLEAELDELLGDING